MKNSSYSWFLIGLEVLLLFAFALNTFSSEGLAGIGIPNATVSTSMEIGNIAPEILNVSVQGGGPVLLVANGTRTVSCVAVIEDFDSDFDLNITNATFYHAPSAGPLSPNDNNDHYANASCAINYSFGSFNGYVDDSYRALANCTFDVEYYANPGEWVCNVSVEDDSKSFGQSQNNASVAELLALGLPDTLDYGVVNSTTVSLEQFVNVTNYGNAVLNLSLSGYAYTPGDGYAMNCSLGAVANISIEHQKYNVTLSNNSEVLSLGQTDLVYTNLSGSPVVNYFNLTARTNDVANDIWKATYWRMYVPIGVAGNCTGNIVFGATTAPGV